MNRGLSSIMAIIILLAVVTVGAAVTAFFSFSTMKTLSEKVSVMFESLSLLRSADKCTLKMILKNVGTKPIVALKFTISGEVHRSQVNVFEPGKSIQIIISLPPEKFNVGNIYTLSLEAEAADGSKTAYTINVMCMWSEV